jgi:hypothetical protein
MGEKESSYINDKQRYIFEFGLHKKMCPLFNEVIFIVIHRSRQGDSIILGQRLHEIMYRV